MFRIVVVSGSSNIVFCPGCSVLSRRISCVLSNTASPVGLIVKYALIANATSSTASIPAMSVRGSILCSCLFACRSVLSSLRLSW